MCQGHFLVVMLFVSTQLSKDGETIRFYPQNAQDLEKIYPEQDTAFLNLCSRPELPFYPEVF